MNLGKRRCGSCGEEHIPRIDWAYWRDGKPYDPNCDAKKTNGHVTGDVGEELHVEIGRSEETGAVIVNFATPVGHLMLPPQDAANLGLTLIAKSQAKIEFNMPDEAIERVIDIVIGEADVVKFDRAAALARLRPILGAKSEAKNDGE